MIIRHHRSQLKNVDSSRYPGKYVLPHNMSHRVKFPWKFGSPGDIFPRKYVSLFGNLSPLLRLNDREHIHEAKLLKVAEGVYNLLLNGLCCLLCAGNKRRDQLEIPFIKKRLQFSPKNLRSFRRNSLHFFQQTQEIWKFGPGRYIFWGDIFHITSVEPYMQGLSRSLRPLCGETCP